MILHYSFKVSKGFWQVAIEIFYDEFVEMLELLVEGCSIATLEVL